MGFMILNDRRNQPRQLAKRQFQVNLPKNKNPAGAIRASGLISALV
jgi:hypothetical protein